MSFHFQIKILQRAAYKITHLNKDTFSLHSARLRLNNATTIMLELLSVL